jgi:hypothetical protein
MVATTKGSADTDTPSRQSTQSPAGESRSEASETDDQRNGSGARARLASAFQVECRSAAPTTSASAAGVS